MITPPFASLGGFYCIVYGITNDHDNEKLAYTLIGSINLALNIPVFIFATIKFHKDDTLVMYTDGLVEAMNAKEEEFEMVGLIKTLKENPKKNSTDLKNEIVSRVNDHIGTIPLSDDFTLLIMRKTA